MGKDLTKEERSELAKILGRRGGLSRSKKKSKASRENGKKSKGAPKKKI